MPLNIIRDDIINMRTDAVVNPSNTSLKTGSGVSEIVFNKAGKEKLQECCNKIAPIKVGEAAITPAFNFPAKFIIHTAGPVFNGLKKELSVSLLKRTYLSALNLAEQNGCKSIAFPLLSSGIYRFPKDIALKTARKAIEEFLTSFEMDVYLLVFDKSSFKISKELLGAVKSYIDENYINLHYNIMGLGSFENSRLFDRRGAENVREPHKKSNESAENAPKRRDADSILDSLISYEIYESGETYVTDEDLQLESAAEPQLTESIFDNLNDYLEEPFADALMKLIDKAGKSDVEVYKRANIDRKLFSKIRSKKEYTPNKTTILALAVSLELSLKETEDLLKKAGYALSHSNKFDVIIEFFIKNSKYNIFEINEVLFSFDQPLLGSKSINAYS